MSVRLSLVFLLWVPTIYKTETRGGLIWKVNSPPVFWISCKIRRWKRTHREEVAEFKRQFFRLLVFLSWVPRCKTDGDEKWFDLIIRFSVRPLVSLLWKPWKYWKTETRSGGIEKSVRRRRRRELAWLEIYFSAHIKVFLRWEGGIYKKTETKVV